MAKDKLTDYDSTASGNLDVGGISVAEGMLPSGVNNAIRELMSHQADAFGAGTPLYVDQTNNRVGIGTASPVCRLEVEDNGSTAGVLLKVTADDSSPYAFVVGNDTFSTANTDGMAIWMGNTGEGSIDARGTGAYMRLRVQGTERMRIDSSGNLLVGTTDSAGGTSGTTEGIALSAGSYGGFIGATRSGDKVATFNRTTSDGDIMEFRKDGTTVGSIGSETGYTYYAGGTAGLMMRVTDVIPTDGNGTKSDNAKDLGDGAYRFDDVFATNGTIQTSDANEKQQIAALTDAEITAAKAIGALFKTFKWNSAVEGKGDAARTHAGVIAQDVEAAMTAAGLDAGDYAFFISSTWWETQTEVPAVEAVDAVYEDVVIPAVLDEDGNEVEAERTEQRTVTEAVEAVDAYTRTDTYETAEEAPEGATERNRKGIRYPELLAFVGAATEHRLANIETRIAALEAN